jgi:hypothetical protein
VDCGAVPSDPPVVAAAEEQYAPEARCSDFVTMNGEPSQWQAQQFYDGVATPEERAALDPDGDGFACSEGNPTAAAHYDTSTESFPISQGEAIRRGEVPLTAEEEANLRAAGIIAPGTEVERAPTGPQYERP